MESHFVKKYSRFYMRVEI